MEVNGSFENRHTSWNLDQIRNSHLGSKLSLQKYCYCGLLLAVSDVFRSEGHEYKYVAC